MINALRNGSKHHIRFSNFAPKSVLISTIYIIILLKSVGVSKLQVAILARSSREMSQTVCII